MMKKLNIHLRPSRLAFLSVLLGAAITFGGCLKDDNGPSQIASTAAIIAVPGSEGLDIALDNNLLNDPYWGEQFGYVDVLPYKNAYPGSRLVRVFDPEGAPDDGPLAYETVNFVAGNFYSLYVVGDDRLEIMVTEDDLSEPGDGHAKIRFMQLSPDAPELDIAEPDRDTILAANMKFKDVTDFIKFDADEPHTFNITAHDGGKLADTISITPKNNSIYTIWLKGLFTTEDEQKAFGHALIKF